MKSIRAGVASTFFAKTGVSFLGLLIVILISRNLGAEGRGSIGLFMSGIALLQLFCDFGSSSALINLSYKLPQKRLYYSAILWIFVTCTLSYAAWIFFPHIAFVYLIPPAAFLYSFNNINQLLLMGNRQVNKRNISLLVFPLALLLLFYLFYNASGTIEAYPGALFVSLIAAALVSYYFVSSFLKLDKEPFQFETEILKQGFWVQAGQAIQFLNYRINFFLVVYFMDESALGIYNNAIILCESIWILGHSIGQMQHMKILNSHGESAHKGLSNRLMVLNFMGSLCLLFILIIIPNGFWTYLFSGEFEDMHNIFIYLAPGVLCFSISNIINHFLHAKNRFRQIALCNTLGLIAGLITAFILIPQLGLQGAGISWSSGLLASMLAYVYTYKNYYENIKGNL